MKTSNLLTLFFGLSILCNTALSQELKNADTQDQFGFIENKGQITDQFGKPNSDVLYLSSLNGLKVQLRKTGFSYECYKIIPKVPDPKFASLQINQKHNIKQYLPFSISIHRIDVEFEGMSKSVEINAEQPFNDYLNYYTTGTPENGCVKVNHFEKITYHNIYPGIDLEFIINVNEQASLKYNFIVHPGANIDDIRMKFNGANDLTLTDSKNLEIKTALGILTENIPYSYQPGLFYGDNNTTINVNYKKEKNTIGFVVETYNNKKDLIIDPTPNLTWGTYYGGTGDEYGYGVTTDINTDIVVSGYTNSATNIATVGAYQTVLAGGIDGIIVKFNSAGVRQWATYYGGSGDDVCADVATDANGNIAIAGWTTSTANIATVGAHQTVFGGGLLDGCVLKFNSAGVRQWATYYGGTGFDESASGVAVDGLGNIYASGWTQSGTAISTVGSHQAAFGGGSYDTYIVKFNPAGVRQWATYYGGNGDELTWWGLGVDLNNNVFLGGYTQSSNNIATVGAHQTVIPGTFSAFLVKFNSAGVRQWGTYYGGFGFTNEDGVCTDANGNVTIAGETQSAGSISTVGSQQPAFGGGSYDAYIVQFNSAGVRQWGTYCGGTADEGFSDVCCDVNNNVIAIGYTASGNNIATVGAQQTVFGGAQWDAFFEKYNSSGVRQWGTYYGGAMRDAGYSITAEASGCVIGVGEVQSSNNISTVGAYQTTIGGSVDAFVAKFCTLIPLTATASQTNLLCNGQCIGTGTANPLGGTTPYTYAWTGGQTTQTATGLCAGTYTVTITDAGSQTATATITITQPSILTATTTNTNENCNGDNNATATVTAGGGTPGYTYLWNNSQTTTTATGLVAGNYSVTVTDANGCTTTQTVIVTQPTILSATTTNTNVNCNGDSSATATAIPSGGTSPYTYLWNNAQTNVTATNLIAGTYTVTVTDANGCTTNQTATVTQPSAITATINFTPTACSSNTGTATASVSGGTPGYTYLWSNAQTSITATALGAGTYTVTVTDANGCTQTVTTTIINANSPTVNANITSAILCNGGTGSATAAASGGTSPYNYLWNNSQTNAIATNLIAGTYTITVTDANGCTSQQTVILTQPNQITLTANATPDTCISSNGTASAIASGGTSPYTYWWSNGPTTQNISNLSSGSYTVTITDANGCTQTQTITVGTTGFITVSAGNDITITQGSSTQLNATGGTTFSWTPSTGLNCTTCANPVASPTVTTTYIVTITNANGCTGTDTVTVFIDIPCNLTSLTTFLPNAFSPNGDAVNNTYCVPSNVCIVSFVLKVYDRWGEKVFESTSTANCWDGTYNDKAVNTGVYVYYFDCVLSTGEPFSQKGNISLIR